MKTCTFFSLILFASSLFISCQHEQFSIREANHDEVSLVAPLGNKLSGDLLKTLKKELTSTIKTEGPLEAISFCSLSALPLTDSISGTAGVGIQVKRTSNKFRNPLNAPDEAEKLALAYFEDLAAKGSGLPDQYVQRTTAGGNISYYFYKPLKMDHACLLCHGKVENTAPDLAARIHELYPNDLAMNYEAGDFRGLVRIKFTGMPFPINK